MSCKRCIQEWKFLQKKHPSVRSLLEVVWVDMVSFVTGQKRGSLAGQVGADSSMTADLLVMSF